MVALQGKENVFLTGAAGTGKSFVIHKFMETQYDPVVLATTGIAAILLNGRTFHSFFCLWNLFAPYETMVESAMQNWRMKQRVSRADTIIIDEVSMLDERTMRAGEEIARRVRGIDEPWGGLRVIAVGDFCQLPPVDPGRKKGQPVKWVFDTDVWRGSGFQKAELTEIMRTGDTAFMDILNKVRRGMVDDDVVQFLQSHTKTEQEAESIEGTRIFARRDEVAAYNARKLAAIDEPLETFDLQFHQLGFFDIGTGDDKDKSKLLQNMPVDAKLQLKRGALVMLRRNNLDAGYANGSLGHYVGRETRGDIEWLNIELLTGGTVQVERMQFAQYDGSGTAKAKASQFPLSLAWASTIHKVQGATLDVVIADLGRLWDSGQAYVAMSRTKAANGFHVLNWSKDSVIIDDRIKQFYGF